MILTMSVPLYDLKVEICQKSYLKVDCHLRGDEQLFDT